VEPGCDEVKVSVTFPLPELVAGNWPLAPTPEAIGANAKPAGIAPSDEVVVLCAGIGVGVGAGVETGLLGKLGGEPPPPPHAMARAANANNPTVNRVEIASRRRRRARFSSMPFNGPTRGPSMDR
jgi:hypothetical protein